MIPYVTLDEIIKEEGLRTGYTLLDERHGCQNGSRLGVSVYRNDAYGIPTSHEDQEGFFVLEGRGFARIDGEELSLTPGMAFLVPPGTPHAMKRDKNADCCRVLWFHAAV